MTIRTTCVDKPAGMTLLWSTTNSRLSGNSHWRTGVVYLFAQYSSGKRRFIADRQWYSFSSDECITCTSHREEKIQPPDFAIQASPIAESGPLAPGSANTQALDKQPSFASPERTLLILLSLTPLSICLLRPSPFAFIQNTFAVAISHTSPHALFSHHVEPRILPAGWPPIPTTSVRRPDLIFFPSAPRQCHFSAREILPRTILE